MNDSIITVENISKQYILGETIRYNAFRDKFENWFQQRFQHKKNKPEEKNFWALKNISFNVKQGEVLGIIGKNGAGKSTLLKILSKITAPTEGKITLKGRIASLLEVGTGFHPELTGRENIFLNGAILGMTKAEIKNKFDAIVSFAEIPKFIDTPVKRYSSGMYVRLAFAVAAHLEPEILLVDEVLAVGDLEFQKKCLGKMGDVAKNGRTVLFVSHNLTAVSQLCEKAILLENGKIKTKDTTQNVIQEYILNNTCSSGTINFPNGYSEHNVNEFKLHQVSLTNPSGQICSQFSSKDTIHIHITYQILENITKCRLGFLLWNEEGTLLFETYDADNPQNFSSRSPGFYQSKCEIPGNFLSPGKYIIEIYSDIYEIKILARTKYILNFNIQTSYATGAHISEKRSGTIRPLLNWNIAPIKKTES